MSNEREKQTLSDLIVGAWIDERRSARIYYKSSTFISVQYVSLLRGDSVAIYAATIGNPREGKLLRL